MGRPANSEQVDQVMVDRIVRTGKNEGANRSERIAALEKIMSVRPDMEIQRVAVHVGVTTRTVQRLARARGWDRRSPRYDADEMHRLIAEAIARCPKITISELQVSLGVSCETVLKYTRSALEAGVITAAQVRRNRVGSVSTPKEAFGAQR